MPILTSLDLCFQLDGQAPKCQNGLALDVPQSCAKAHKRQGEKNAKQQVQQSFGPGKKNHRTTCRRTAERPGGKPPNVLALGNMHSVGCPAHSHLHYSWDCWTPFWMANHFVFWATSPPLFQGYVPHLLGLKWTPQFIQLVNQSPILLGQNHEPQTIGMEFYLKILGLPLNFHLRLGKPLAGQSRFWGRYPRTPRRLLPKRAHCEAQPTFTEFIVPLSSVRILEFGLTLTT